MNKRSVGGRHRAQHGVAAVEFVLVAIVFFMIVFGIIELARIIYMYNTLADVTRSAARSAANIDWRNTTLMDQARRRAIFRDNAGGLAFGAPITDQYIRIDYFYLAKDAVSGAITMAPVSAMPECPARNRHNCQTSPYSNGASAADTCVRLVRARICSPDSATCDRVNYQMLLPLIDLTVPLPTSTTLVTAETLGYQPGDPDCL